MKKEMRKAERRLSDEMTKEILNNGLYGVLSTVGEDGMPYGVPMSYAVDGSRIYFHCAPEGHKLDNIIYNNNVSFTVVDGVETLADKFSTKYRSVITFGKISVADDVAEKRKGIEAIMMKYCADFADAGDAYIKKYFERFKILFIDIESISGKGRLE